MIKKVAGSVLVWDSKIVFKRFELEERPTIIYKNTEFSYFL